MSTLSLWTPLASSGARIVAEATQAPPAVTPVFLILIAVLTAALATRPPRTTYVVVADPWVRVKAVAAAVLVGAALALIALALLRR